MYLFHDVVAPYEFIRRGQQQTTYKEEVRLFYMITDRATRFRMALFEYDGHARVLW